MASMAQNLLRFNNTTNIPQIYNNAFRSKASPTDRCSLHLSSTSNSPSPLNLSLSLLPTRAVISDDVGDGGRNNNAGSGGGGKGQGGGGGGGNNGDRDDADSSSSPSPSSGLGLLGLFINGWRSRVLADPQFPFKVLMEEVVGVSANVAGDMASRPNFGLNELDLVFSTLVVGAILNFLLMYILAPTSSTTAAVASMSHMFEPGPYTVLDRLGTFVYKGAVFAVVGFAAGLVGTAISTGLVKMRKKMSASGEEEEENKSPPTVLNALTWATHMGLSCNLRYQSLNGIEYLLAKGLPPLGFKASVFVLRCLNNVVGGVSFVTLARLTGSQTQKKQKALQEQA